MGSINHDIGLIIVEGLQDKRISSSRSMFCDLDSELQWAVGLISRLKGLDHLISGFYFDLGSIGNKSSFDSQCSGDLCLLLLFSIGQGVLSCRVWNLILLEARHSAVVGEIYV